MPFDPASAHQIPQEAHMIEQLGPMALGWIYVGLFVLGMFIAFLIHRK